MAKTLKASIIIGGAVSGAFRAALTTTRGNLKQIGSAIAEVDRKQRMMGQSIQVFGRQGKNVDGLRRQYGELSRQADRLRLAYTRLDAAENRLIRNREVIGRAGAAFGAALGATAAVAMPIGAAANRAATFQAENQLIGNTANMNPGQIRLMGRDILAASKASNQSAEEVQRSVGFLVAAGLKFETVKASIRTIGRTTTANRADIEDLSRAAFTLIDTLKISPDGLQSALDILAVAGKEGNVELRDMAKVLPVLSSSFVALKMQGNEAAATMGAALEVARKGAADADEAANNMKNYLAKVLSPETLKKAQKKFGLDLYAVIQNAQRTGGNPFEASMQAIMKATAGDQKKLGELFQDMQVQNFLRPMIQNWDEYVRIKNLALNSSAGTTDRDFDTMMSTSRAKIDMVKNSAGRLAITFGQALAPSVGNAAEKLSGLLNRTSDFVARHPGITAALAKSALGLGVIASAATGASFAFHLFARPVLYASKLFRQFQAGAAVGQLGRVGAVATRAASAFRIVATAVGAIGGGPIALVAAGLTAGALVVRKYWQPIKTFFGGLWDGLREGATLAFGELKTALEPLRPAWDAMSGAIRGAWNWIVKLLAPVELSGQEITRVAGVGKVVGHVIANSFRVGVKVIGSAVGAAISLGKAIGWVIGKAVQLSNAVSKLPMFRLGAQVMNGILGETRGTQPSVSLGLTRGKPAPLSPTVTSGRGAMTKIGVGQQTVNVSIAQQPGQSSDELARLVTDRIKREGAVASRGALADR